MPLRGRKNGRELVAAHEKLRRGDDDRALALEQPAGVDDRDSDQPAAGVVAESMTLGRLIEVDRLRWIADAEVEDVGVPVVGLGRT